MRWMSCGSSPRFLCQLPLLLGAIVVLFLVDTAHGQQCGPLAGNKTCLSVLGTPACCSSWGWCGTDSSYCAPGNCVSECAVPPSTCGDFICNANETCSTCPHDCGPCPPTATDLYQCDPSVGNLKYALTFDDGPTPEYGVTAGLLDVLKAENVKASFEVIGNRLNDPAGLALVQRAIAEGHLVISHTYTHPDLTLLTKQQIRNELSNAERAIRQATCKRAPRWLRPPYGSINDAVSQTLAEMGYRAVMWNLDTEDWAEVANGTTADIITYTKGLIDSMYPQSILSLEHDLFNLTTAAVQSIIQYAKAKGYTFIRLDECLIGQGSSQTSAQYTWAQEPEGYTCLDDHLNPLGGFMCSSSSQCGNGTCVGGYCTCQSGYTCPQCTAVYSSMSPSAGCPPDNIPLGGDSGGSSSTGPSGNPTTSSSPSQTIGWMEIAVALFSLLVTASAALG